MDEHLIFSFTQNTPQLSAASSSHYSSDLQTNQLHIVIYK